VKKLYVGNLPFQATEEDVQALFTENGITSGTVTLIRDRFTGQLRGFGFVEINEDGEAEKAVAALNGKDFKGRKIVVNEARPQREGGGGGGGGRGPGSCRCAIRNDGIGLYRGEFPAVLESLLAGRSSVERDSKTNQFLVSPNIRKPISLEKRASRERLIS
jgi:RNA recognition motif-containing protein